MDKIKLITLEKVLEMKENEKPFKLVEVLKKDAFEKEHIPGAVNIPFKNLDQNAPEELEKEETIVVYCANYHCSASTAAARKLLELGYDNVLDFKAGKKGWKDAGLELESGKSVSGKVI